MSKLYLLSQAYSLIYNLHQEILVKLPLVKDAMSILYNVYTGVYSSTNWLMLTRAQNSTLKLNFETQSFKPKCKKSKNCLDYLERALFILFLPIGVINNIKWPYKKKKET